MTDIEKQRKKDPNSYTARSAYFAAMVAHAAVVLFTAVIAYKSLPGIGELFPWHPFLMTLAFVLFMTEGILMFSQQSGLIRGERKLQVRSHWLFQLIMAICSIGGFLAIYLNKNHRGKEHFTTWHGLLGVITFALALTQASFGIFLLYPSLFSRFITLAKAKIYHATHGLLVYTMIVLVLNLALWSNWASRNITGALWYICIACVDILGLVVMTQVTNNVLPRLRRTS